jgi:hypothetical protein
LQALDDEDALENGESHKNGKIEEKKEAVDHNE